MSTPVDLSTILGELRSLAASVGPVPEHLAAIDAKLAALPTSAEVDELRGIVHELQADVQKLKAIADGPPPIPEQLKTLKEAYDKFVVATAEREDDIAEVAGVAGDKRHDAASAAVAAPLIAASEARGALQISTMSERLSEFGVQLAALAKAFRENQSAVLVITGVAALGLAALVLFLISAFGAPVIP